MAPQYVRFIVEEVIEGGIGFYPTYGKTLMGLAASRPLQPADNFSLTYYAPQPRAVLRVVDPSQTSQTRKYGEWGRVELTTLTPEFFMPRFLERDEAVRREPSELYPWDGVESVKTGAVRQPAMTRAAQAAVRGICTTAARPGSS